ncbi:hypothetical protein AXF42_Ash010699 [Apostasia shenzhenica]|uniref:Uncharacterized protein n=1 Tax=Apostasia shenzhenica TaxID=1088818 RepID=A0A2I0A6T5_9ASPA|nr:hypothetical protein AXF42_Ash010699 [Apostasia shenzhenica]
MDARKGDHWKPTTSATCCRINHNSLQLASQPASQQNSLQTAPAPASVDKTTCSLKIIQLNREQKTERK